MAYRAEKSGMGYQIYDPQNKPVEYGTADVLSKYSLSPTQLTQSDTSPFVSQNWYNQNLPQQQPAATAPQTSAPQVQPPPVPQAQVAQPQQATPQPVAASTGTPQPTYAPQSPQSAPGQAQPGQVGTLAMPATGSVVDLLNMAGQESSYAARKQLAQQYGIQGYTGTAQQNIDLSKKFLDAYNAKKGTPAPQTGADARSAIQTFMQEEQPQQEDPEMTFFDQYSGMNPVTKTLYDSINNLLSTPATTTTFKEEFAKLQAEQGIPALNTELMNIKNIMDGTEDDIRTEITKAGGFATDSQVQALAAARNKTLLKQATQLSDQLAIKQDYVDQLMQFSKLDRDAVEKQVDRRLNLTEKLADIQDKLNTAAKDNYKTIVDEVGFQGLAGMVAGNAEAQSVAEKTLGLPKGTLANPTAVKFLTPEKEKKPLQFVSGTDNQRAGVFDPNTGTFTASGGGTGGGVGGYGNLPLPVRQSADSLRDAADNLASSFGTKFQKDAFMSQVDNLLNKGNLTGASELIFSRAIQQIPDAEQRKKVTGRYEMVKRLNQIEGLLDDFYSKGGTTGYFTGSAENIRQKFGDSNNPDLAKIGTTIMNAIDELVRFRTGAALTEQEDKYYQKMLPGIWKSAQLNEANIVGLRDSLQFDVESTLQNQLTVEGYRAVTDALMNSVVGMTPMTKENGVKTGTASNGKQVTMNPDGSITDAVGNKYDRDGNMISSTKFTGQTPTIVSKLK